MYGSVCIEWKGKGSSYVESIGSNGMLFADGGSRNGAATSPEKVRRAVLLNRIAFLRIMANAAIALSDSINDPCFLMPSSCRGQAAGP